MKNLWNESDVKDFNKSELDLRVYSSRLLGQSPELVLHGGGNTSVKMTETTFLGEREEILYVKGSGWDLATIQREGFSPVKMSVLLKLARRSHLSDSDMVREQRAAMTDPTAPNPSVEAILHALIPFRFVDHTHANAIIAIGNAPSGAANLQNILGAEVLVVPYVMPGFVLARQIFEITKDLDWNRLKGILLLHHGLFTFGETARESYDRMIDLVTKCEQHIVSGIAQANLKAQDQPTRDKTTAAPNSETKSALNHSELLTISKLRKQASLRAGRPVVVRLDASTEAREFSNRGDLLKVAKQGPLTPDHVIQTKRVPVILHSQPETDVAEFEEDYKSYFQQHAKAHHQMLDPAPRWAVWPGHGTLALGLNFKQTSIISDISKHTRQVIQQSEALGGWSALSEKDIFEVEYWELEQAKLKKATATPEFEGQVALVTGAASGIGKACVDELRKRGAVVGALDISPTVHKQFQDPGVLTVTCDLTDPGQIQIALSQIVENFGGLDLVVSNAGTFPASQSLSEMDESLFEKTLKVNVASHQFLLKQALPFLAQGWRPSVIFMGSKNVPAPGPGAAAYSAAKAALTQLARVAALELGAQGIRVNVVHPNQVFDTGIWTDEVLKKRAQHYGLSVDDYKRNNLLKTEVTSKDVARLVATMLGSAFAKTTGAQVPIDGGNDRVI